MTETTPIAIERDVLSWAVDLDEKTRAQAARTAAMPFVEKPLALMADAHLGMGATIGSVIATHGAIIPAAVGVDIGCGMIAAQLPMTASQLPDDLGDAHAAIATTVPAGIPTRSNKGGGSHTEGRAIPADAPSEADVRRAQRQMGTLGSGNHFVELTVDEADGVWLVLHSGSRGVGNKLAQHHIAEAKGLMKRYFIELDDDDLAYFVERTAEFDAYISAMLWAQDYAAMNRATMLSGIVDALGALWSRDLSPTSTVNCHHNYTEREHHHGKDCWVTRKGAIRAREGDLGVIPGSMATGSFVVRGKGSAASYTSASHGAGRKMSRTAARKTLSAESLDARMEGIAWNRTSDALLDEHPEAYKDLGEVMAAQADLVEIEHQLTTVVNFKGE